MPLTSIKITTELVRELHLKKYEEGFKSVSKLIQHLMDSEKEKKN
jgi:hypothetical protein